MSFLNINPIPCCSLDAMVKAGWDLFDHLEGLSESQGGDFATKGISSALASMEAVASQRQRLAFMADIYVRNATQFIGGELNRISDSALPAPTEDSLIECSVPDHSELQSELDELLALLHVDFTYTSRATFMNSHQLSKNFTRLSSALLHQISMSALGKSMSELDKCHAVPSFQRK